MAAIDGPAPDVPEEPEKAPASPARKKQRQPRKRPAKDPCMAGLQLLRLQVLFLQNARTPMVLMQAPLMGIDPEFWGPGAHEFALRHLMNYIDTNLAKRK